MVAGDAMQVAQQYLELARAQMEAEAAEGGRAPAKLTAEAKRAEERARERKAAFDQRVADEKAARRYERGRERQREREREREEGVGPWRLSKSSRRR
jgi:hypothetical protein